MEKLFLGTFFSYNKLDIIDEQDINITVSISEFCDRRVISISDGLDQFVGKCLWSDIENLQFRMFRLYKMRNSMHQVSFTQSGAAINKERIVDFTWWFRNGKGSGMSKAVIASDDESVKSIVRIQVWIFGRLTHRIFLWLDRADLLCLFRKNKLYVIFDACHFCDCHFNRKIVLLINIIEPHLFGRNQDKYFIILNRINIKGLQPGIVGYVRQFVFLFHTLQYVIPFLFH